MKSIVTPETMRTLEQDVMDAGTTDAELIERAASEIADYLDARIQSRGGSSRRVLAVAGPGNNGVDAIVAASLLCDLGWDAYALLVDRENLSEHPSLEAHLERVEVVDEIPRVDVILDGIFGNSGRTDLPESAINALNAIRSAAVRTRALVVAVDCPTGTNTLSGEVAEEIVSADVTLCISNPKIGMLKAPAYEHLGELVVLDIGLDTATPDPDVNAALIDESFVRTALPARGPGAHKSQVGGLLIVGGAPGYYGAPRLTGEAALRAGCGYVGLAVPRSIVGAIASAVPELIYHPLSDADGRNSAKVVTDALSEGKRYDAIVIGPGLGRDEVAADFLQALFEPSAKGDEEVAPEPVFGIPRRQRAQVAETSADISAFPLVLDADALNWLSQLEDWPAKLEGFNCILTPHVGEMARLLDVEGDDVAADPWNVARDAAVKWNQVVVLKNPFSCVATPDGELRVAPRLTPELASPGTGDVLSGLIGAFLAQGAPPVDAAALALHIGATAGGFARLDRGTRAVLARDAIEHIGIALKLFDSAAVNRMSSLA